ncbi:M24 family metallopeptidase [Paracandidimonas lactea]|uniref:M24 family metallopeptidase n=1 Tax=Paracandidimonas lactea TaxID=2895524 RepID=UPI001F2C0EA0|nr:M24 family metallopeptidase [Paracandidimonas lactea]
MTPTKCCPPGHLRERIAILESECVDRGLDLVIVYGKGSNLGPATKSHGYMRYLCDWNGYQNDSVLILTPGKSPVLLVAGIFLKFRADRYFWIEDTRFIKAADTGAYLGRLCADISRPTGSIGVIGFGEMPAAAWNAFNDKVPGLELVNLEGFVDRQRLIKTDAQLGRHQAAAALCDRMFETLRQEIKTPRPSFQLQAELERTARYAGAEYCMTWLTVGPQADYCRFFNDECERTPQPGDQVLLGIYLMLDGHWGHAIRSGTMGRATRNQDTVFVSAQKMWEAMKQQLIPGADLASVHQAAEDVIMGDYPALSGQIFRFRHGHGLGHSYEDPIASLSFPQAYDGGAQPQSFAAQPGMLFELHPNLFVPELGGAAIGDMVATLETGNRTLTNYPRDHINWLE